MPALRAGGQGSAAEVNEAMVGVTSAIIETVNGFTPSGMYEGQINGLTATLNTMAKYKTKNPIMIMAYKAIDANLDLVQHGDTRRWANWGTHKTIEAASITLAAIELAAGINQWEASRTTLLEEVVIESEMPLNVKFSRLRGRYVESADIIKNDLNIPDNWHVKKSNRDGGVRFTDPNDPANNHIRVMPGEPNSPFENSRSPYVKEVKNGSLVDKNGKKIPSGGKNQNRSSESHIPVNEYRYKP